MASLGGNLTPIRGEQSWLTMPDGEFEGTYRPARGGNRSYLHRALLRALAPIVERWPSEPQIMSKPLMVDLLPPYPRRLRFYVHCVTQHPSERQMGTFKAQLTSGIIHSEPNSRRLFFDRSDNIRPMLVGYVPDWRLFVLWDAELHDLDGGFPYSKNVQVPPDVVWSALAQGLSQGTRRLKRPSVTESIIATRPSCLPRALELRMRLSNHSLFHGLGNAKNTR